MVSYNLGNIHVLLVEKHVYMRKIIRDILGELGVKRVREASTVEEAFVHFKEEPSDLVLTDWSPSLDGVKMIRAVRRSPDSPDPYVPIIVVTAHTEMRHVCEARDAGMTEFLAKPISAKILYYRIKAVIERYRLFIRAKDYFGPDRRRRRVDIKGPDRRNHTNKTGQDRRVRQEPHAGGERRQGYPGYQPQDLRDGPRST